MAAVLIVVLNDTPFDERVERALRAEEAAASSTAVKLDF